MLDRKEMKTELKAIVLPERLRHSKRGIRKRFKISLLKRVYLWSLTNRELL
ncbi:hypothetical protein A1Q_2326 [Vibrio campbellii HY01]|nr:hypothetical protein A1Q_2326 [Vibrio campbellii HY01]